jgi:hypothetical protein
VTATIDQFVYGANDAGDEGEIYGSVLARLCGSSYLFQRSAANTHNVRDTGKATFYSGSVARVTCKGPVP